MPQDLISVLIPVYNSENYLAQCLDSVISQTYSNIEIICCNDCSTDSSLNILKRYQQIDARISIINNTKNKGISDTRLELFKKAQGDYIYSLDSDDWIEPCAIEKLYEYHQFDLVIGSSTVHKIDGTTHILRSIPSDSEFFLYGTDIYEFHKNMVVSFHIWNILIKSELITGIHKDLALYQDREINLGEDIIIRVLLCKSASSMAFIPLTAHHYRKVINSLDSSIHQEGRDKGFILEVAKKRIKAVETTAKIFNYEKAKVVYQTKRWLTKDIALYYSLFTKKELIELDELFRNISVFNLLSEVKQEKLRFRLKKLHLLKVATKIKSLKNQCINFLKKCSYLNWLKSFVKRILPIRQNLKEYTKLLKASKRLRKQKYKANKQVQHRDTSKIDLVYLWVESNDPSWQKKFNHAKFGLEYSEGMHNSRFDSIDELKYSLRSVEKYASWVNHIYIVTDNQRPEWLADTHKITIVDHTEICSPEVLPLFNSNALEMFLHKIPGLSECFLYANDDMIFLNRVTKKDFFYKNGSTKNYFTLPYNPINFGIWEYTILSVLDKVHNKLGTPLNIFPSHIIDSYNKSDYQYVMEEFFEAWSKETSMNTFRKPLELTRYAVNLVSLVRNNTKPYLIRKKFSDIKTTYPYNWFGFTMNMHSFTEKSARDIQRTKPKMICLNDSINATATHKVLAKKFLEEQFPHKGTFEK